MSQRKRKAPARKTSNRKRNRPEKGEGFLRSVNKRSHDKTNRRLKRGGGKPVWATIAIEDILEDTGETDFSQKLTRLLLVAILLPLCWVTTWTFLKRFSHATVEQGFWQSPQFWYFAVGVLIMLGWFWSKLAQPFFLYLYVFGHEVTHAAFVKCFGGRVLDIEWGSEGGYVTTDKTNWVISLSPYFVPFWSLIAVIVHVFAGLFFEILPVGNLVFYGVIGATWGFHLAWTLWMIPRDQPDLQDNGTFLSLVLIYFGNLIVLIALLCLSSPSPVESFKEFGYSWFGIAMTWGDVTLRWVQNFLESIPSRL
ncbi:MAG: hypothetical protein IZT59_06285 [Verrucomicrobia bacterium]|jgi:hypothetical protein|nr:hypothetical protein [Verrucomicrobiota bacterium]|tara:strand:- start:3067 stop:3993 length:927 start_codon:yes stop_codon:yes gene_type:complete